LSEDQDEAHAALEAACQATFAGREEDEQLADHIESQHPDCICETVRVSPGSPSPVANDEHLYRVIVTPRDISPEGVLHSAPFEKVAKSGLSVVRSIATREDLGGLVRDGMYRKPLHAPRSVRRVYRANVGGEDGVRSQREGGGSRLFGVYDQVVARTVSDQAPVPTHAGIFLRYPPKGTENRKKAQKDFAGTLRDLFIENEVPLDQIHEGLISQINDEAASGAFVLEDQSNQ